MSLQNTINELQNLTTDFDVDKEVENYIAKAVNQDLTLSSFGALRLCYDLSYLGNNAIHTGHNDADKLHELNEIIFSLVEWLEDATLNEMTCDLSLSIYGVYLGFKRLFDLLKYDYDISKNQSSNSIGGLCGIVAMTLDLFAGGLVLVAID